MNNLQALSMSLRGDNDNVEQPLYVTIEDASAVNHTVTHPVSYVLEVEEWFEWDVALQAFADAGVDVSQVKKLTIGIGDGTASAQTDVDTLYVDKICLYTPRCLNPDGLDMRGDVNGDCEINMTDFAILSSGWLNNGMSATP